MKKAFMMVLTLAFCCSMAIATTGCPKGEEKKATTTTEKKEEPKK